MNTDTVVKVEWLKTSDVSEETGLAVSTINKYSRELEDQNYVFQKDRDTRLYTAEDIQVLRIIKDLRERTNISVREAVRMIMTKRQHGRTTDAAERHDDKRSVATENAAIPSIQGVLDASETRSVATLLEKLVIRISEQDEVIRNLSDEIRSLRDAQRTDVQKMIEIQQKLLQQTSVIGTRLEREQEKKKEAKKPWWSLK